MGGWLGYDVIFCFKTKWVMKRFTLVLAACLVSGAASGQVEKVDPQKFCTPLSETAAQIMKSRQMGVPMSKVIGVFKEEGAALYRNLTVEAYDSPRFSTKPMIEKAVSDFESKAFLDCYKALTAMKDR